MTSDDNLGHLELNKRIFEASVFHPWTGEVLWGMPLMSMIRLDWVLLKVLPAPVFMNIYHGLCLTLSAWLLALYLRNKGLHPMACLFGAGVAFWVGTNLTLVYAGHAGKYGAMVLLSLAIYALGRWGQTGRRAWSVLAGSAAGSMFLEQPDFAMFCMLLLAPVGIYEGVQVVGRGGVGAWVKQSWCAVLAAGLLMVGAALSAKGSGVTDLTDAQTPEERWAYVTQWSQPPGESLDFIAPGWSGWRSGEESGPYWGIMGRSDGWEETRQGFMNFKLENVYVGAVPLLFALMGLAAGFQRRKQGQAAALVWLWASLCVVALLLAFGKFFPLYRPLSLLPGFSSIRNPNKFIHFFQIAWGVMAAFGLDAALSMEASKLRKWQWGAVAVAGLFFLAGLALWADLTDGAARLAALGWGELGRAIQWNKAFSVTYAGGAFLVGGGILWLFSRAATRPQGQPVRPSRKWGGWTAGLLAGGLPLLLVAFDAAVILAPRYVQTMPPGYVAENDLMRYLKQELGPNRTALATQDGFYNHWLMYLFPYHGISSVNVAQLPRPPADYVAFWNAVKDPVRRWELAAVSHVLAHGPVAGQLMANPDWGPKLEVAWSYRPYDDGRGGVGTLRVPASLQAPEVVLRLKETPPRVAAVSSWRVAEDKEALQTLASPEFRPGATLLLAPGDPVPSPPAGESALASDIEITRLIPGRYEFTVRTLGPVAIRVAEKYDSNWKATVNGKRVSVRRADFMFQSVLLEAAQQHDVVMWYAPSRVSTRLQGAGLLAGMGAGLWLVLPHRRKQE